MGADLDLCFTSAAGLRAQYLEGSLSVLEVVRNALDRIAETNLVLNALTHIEDENALASAQACDRLLVRMRRVGDALPPLFGIPVSVKELIEVRGMPCRYGSRTMANHLPTNDAPSVARLRAAGAIIVGTTNTSEFGFRGYTDNPMHGATRNPWDTSRTPGGSSGGAASSVAAGITPIALGTDGGGSIRNPSSLTGLVGIKAQFGRVPVFPTSATATLAHVGPIARNADDAATLLRAIAGADLRDWTSIMAPMDLGPGLADVPPLRVAYSPTFGYGRLDTEVETVLGSAIKTLEDFCGTIAFEEKVCEDESEAFLAEFIGGCSARLGDIVTERPEDLDPMLLKLVHAFRDRSVSHYMGLQQRRVALRERLRQLFEKFDVLLSPMMPCTAWKIGARAPDGFESYRLWTFFGYPFNLTGQPAATLPCGYSSSGLPIGLQIVVAPQREKLLLELLARFESILDCSRIRPAI